MSVDPKLAEAIRQAIPAALTAARPGPMTVDEHREAGCAAFIDSLRASGYEIVAQVSQCTATKPKADSITSQRCRRPEGHEDMHISDPLEGSAGPIPLGRSSIRCWKDES